MKILNSTTDTILSFLVLAMTVFTFLGKIDPKDFMGVVLMVCSYRFGKAVGQSQNAV